MELLGIGIPELILVLVLALIFVGPERLPEVAARLGGWVRELRRYASDVTAQFSGDLEEIRRELEATRKELQQTRDEVRRGTDSISTELSDVSSSLKKSASDVNTAVAESVPEEDKAGR
jgi:Tat protein translocase TatB subunit